MNLLCLDTCIEEISITLLKEKNFFFEKKWARSFEGGPTTTFFSLLSQLCQEADLPLHHLDGIGVTRGPGSFTGIRIGLSIAQGLCLALQKPLTAPTLFELWHFYAQPLFPTQSFWLLVNTYGAFWAVQPYNFQDNCQEEAFLIKPQELLFTLESMKQETAPPLLIGWNIRSTFSSYSPSLLHDLAEENLNNAHLLATYMLQKNLTCTLSDNLSPYYLNTPTFIKQR